MKNITREEITKVVYLGTENVQKAFDIFYNQLLIDKAVNEVVEIVDYQQGFFVLRTNKRYIKAKNLIVATGKCGVVFNDYLIKQFDIETVKNNPLLGVRLEARNHQLKPLKNLGNNPKIKKFYKNDEYVKTHCFCFGGEVISYACGPYQLVGGKSSPDKLSSFTNVNLLYKSSTANTRKDILNFLDRMKIVYPRKVFCQEVSSFLGGFSQNSIVPPLKEEMSVDLKTIYPSIVLNALQDFICFLQSEYKLDLSGGLVHATAAEYFGSNINLSFEMESSFPGLYFVGDGSGKTQGIISAAITGIRAGRAIMRR